MYNNREGNNLNRSDMLDSFVDVEMENDAAAGDSVLFKEPRTMSTSELLKLNEADEKLSLPDTTSRTNNPIAGGLIAASMSASALAADNHSIDLYSDGRDVLRLGQNERLDASDGSVDDMLYVAALPVVSKNHEASDTFLQRDGNLEIETPGTAIALPAVEEASSSLSAAFAFQSKYLFDLDALARVAEEEEEKAVLSLSTDPLRNEVLIVGDTSEIEKQGAVSAVPAAEEESSSLSAAFAFQSMYLFDLDALARVEEEEEKEPEPTHQLHDSKDLSQSMVQLESSSSSAPISPELLKKKADNSKYRSSASSEKRLDFFGMGSSRASKKKKSKTPKGEETVAVLPAAASSKTAISLIHDEYYYDAVEESGTEKLNDSAVSDVHVPPLATSITHEVGFADAFMNLLPQRLPTGLNISGVASGVSFFDNVDDVNLEEDPILNQVKANRQQQTVTAAGGAPSGGISSNRNSDRSSDSSPAVLISAAKIRAWQLIKSFNSHSGGLDGLNRTGTSAEETNPSDTGAIQHVKQNLANRLDAAAADADEDSVATLAEQVRVLEETMHNLQKKASCCVSAVDCFFSAQQKQQLRDNSCFQLVVRLGSSLAYVVLTIFAVLLWILDHIVARCLPLALLTGRHFLKSIEQALNYVFPDRVSNSLHHQVRFFF